MQAKKNECINEIDELVEEIRTMCHKNVQSIKSLKKYNIPNIEFKISEIQSKAARFFSISSGELKKLPLPKLEKVKIKCVNHIDKLLNQDLYLQQLSSKCSFLQENCVTLKDDSDEETPEVDKSESLTAILRLSNANLSQMTIPESDSECSQSSKAERVNNNSRISKRGDSIREESPKVSKREYDNLFNEHMKALETIKELKRKIVQKHEEENLGRLSNNGKKNNEQKENNIRKNNNNSYGKPNINEQRRMRNCSQHYSTNSQPEVVNNFVSPKNTPNNNNINNSKTQNAYNNNAPANSETYSNNYNNKQLWSYIFQLQTNLLEEVHQNQSQKRMLALELDKQNKIIKQLMKEKLEIDSLKGYQSMAQYMELMDSHEVLEVIKGARDVRNNQNSQKKMEEMKKEFTEKIDRLNREKAELLEEINNLKSDLENTKNESIYFLQSQENEKEKNDKMFVLEKEKLEIERNLLEIERNKLKTEKEELMRLRELAKLSENRGSYFKK